MEIHYIRTFNRNFLLPIFLLLASCGGDDIAGPEVSSDKLDVPKSLSIGGNETTGQLMIKANCHWEIQKQTDADWINVQPIQGTGDANVTITTNSINPSAIQERSTTLVCKSAGGISRSIAVTQAVATEFLSVDPDRLVFDYQAGSKEFTVNSNSSWVISGVAPWFRLSATEGKGTQAITVTVQENTSETDDRSPVTLSVTSSSGKTYPVLVSQSHHETVLEVNPTSLRARAPQGTYQIQLTGDAQWTATSNSDWAIIDKSSGTGSTTIAVACRDNTTLAEREASITISTSRQNFIIKMIQDAGTLPTLTALQVSGVTMYGATIVGAFSSAFPITDFGLCYGEDINPTIEAAHISIGGGTATNGSISYTFSQQSVVLNAATRYYVRAYATSSVGTAYSENATFETVGKIPGIDDNDRPNPIKHK